VAFGFKRRSRIAWFVRLRRRRDSMSRLNVFSGYETFFCPTSNQHGIELFFLATITVGKLRPQPIHDGSEPLEFSFMNVEQLERIRFYPSSFVEKLKTLRDDRSWSETNAYVRNVP
jgi:hypothetical protein